MTEPSEQGAILTGDERLAPGVGGYCMDMPDGLFIPVITADNEGSGDVGRFLDSLPTDRRVVVPNVISPRLAGMLVRRGFAVASEWFEDAGEWIEVYERRDGPPPTFERTTHD
jgi:hypothetical protein